MIGGTVSTGTTRSWRYGIALLAVVVATVATSLLRMVAPQRPLSLICFFAAVAVSAGFGGLWPGVLATILSALAYDYFFLQPLHSLLVAGSDLSLFVVFILVALLINGLSERLQAGTKAVKDELAAINGITAAISTSLELGKVIETLKGQLVEQLNLPAGLLFLEEEATGQLYLEDSWGIPEAIAQSLVPQHFRTAYATQHASEQTEPPEWLAQNLQDSLAPGLSQMGWAACLPVQLMANGEIQGILYLQGQDSSMLTEDRRAFFEALGRQIGVVIQNARLYEQVRSGRERLHTLSRQLVHVQETERRALARELHDEIGQILTGLKLSIEMSVRLPGEAAFASLQNALSLVNELMVRVDDLSLNLRPAILDDLGLLPALLWHFERFAAVTNIHVQCEQSGLDARFPYEVETAAYRIVQEALTNIARHAQTQEATVRLWAMRDHLGIQVIDHGVGFAVQTAMVNADTSGLAGMEERATLLGGWISVESTPGEGTCLTAELPLQEPPIAGNENE